MSEGISEITIFYNQGTGCYGFSTRFPGRRPHHVIDTFSSVKDALNCCDGHHEHIWEEVSDADETKLLISRDFKAGTVGSRMAYLTLAELGAAGSEREGEGEKEGQLAHEHAAKSSRSAVPISGFVSAARP